MQTALRTGFLSKSSKTPARLHLLPPLSLRQRHLLTRPVRGPPLAPRAHSTMPLLDPLSSLISSFKKEQIIPDVIPESFSFTPSVLFSVTYPSGHEVIPGKELIREDTLDEPEIILTPMGLPDQGTQQTDQPSYTLVMTDPDAPSRAEPKYRQFRHWVITGLKAPAISASETSNLNALKTKASTTPYRPPGPPPGSGFHRYIFLLFQEPSSEFTVPQGEPEHGSTLEDRRSWDAIKFGEKYGLKLVGATYFLVKSKDA